MNRYPLGKGVSSFPAPPQQSDCHESLPDVTIDNAPAFPGTLDRVGMSEVEVAVRLVDASGETVLSPARADVYVSLDDPHVKGIHMSRLFGALQDGLADNLLSLDLLRQLLDGFVESQNATSKLSMLQLTFDHLVWRRALISDRSGLRTYPVRILGHREPSGIRFWVHARVTYSSTCPCSAALSKQLLQQEFDRDFADEEVIDSERIRNWLGQAIGGIPHSQRSYADVTVELNSDQVELPFSELVELVENSLGTPVQSVVKRIDEQEFARCNAENPMFCEDAARRIRMAIDRCSRFSDYRIEVRHLESLHPHDAVAVVTKGANLRP